MLPHAASGQTLPAWASQISTLNLSLQDLESSPLEGSGASQRSSSGWKHRSSRQASPHNSPTATKVKSPLTRQSGQFTAVTGAPPPSAPSPGGPRSSIASLPQHRESGFAQHGSPTKWNPLQARLANTKKPTLPPSNSSALTPQAQPKPNHAQDRTHMRWKRGKMIGSGAYGKVSMGINLDTGQLIAVKSIEFNPSDPQIHRKVAALQKEIKTMKTLNHPNIVRYVFTEREGANINIFMEFVPGGSLLSLLGQFGALGEAIVASYTSQMVSAINYLHENGVIHRDIKCANVLVSVNGDCKLSDFGSSTLVHDVVEPNDMQGTPFWMAPEVIKEEPFGKPCDIWSLGCTVMEMLTARHPFHHVTSNIVVAMRFIASDEPVCLPPDLNVAAECRNLLTSCLQRPPDDRPKASDLLHHPFFELSDINGCSDSEWDEREDLAVLPAEIISRPTSIQAPETAKAWTQLSFSGLTTISHTDHPRAVSPSVGSELHDILSDGDEYAHELAKSCETQQPVLALHPRSLARKSEHPMSSAGSATHSNPNIKDVLPVNKRWSIPSSVSTLDPASTPPAPPPPNSLNIDSRGGHDHETRSFTSSPRGSLNEVRDRKRPREAKRPVPKGGRIPKDELHLNKILENWDTLSTATTLTTETIARTATPGRANTEKEGKSFHGSPKRATITRHLVTSCLSLVDLQAQFEWDDMEDLMSVTSSSSRGLGGPPRVHASPAPASPSASMRGSRTVMILP
eukprot:Sspe_Gene.30201::Locus_14851_Transcript_1_1_Confidence_1.000_Length_2309::g.30201::m.30201